MHADKTRISARRDRVARTSLLMLGMYYPATPVPSSDRDAPSSPVAKRGKLPFTSSRVVTPPPSSPTSRASEHVANRSPTKQARPTRTHVIHTEVCGIEGDKLCGSYTTALILGRLNAGIVTVPGISSLVGSQPVKRVSLPKHNHFVSRAHAIVRWVPFATELYEGGTKLDGAFIVKILGQNGLVVDGKRFHGGRVIRLVPGSTVLDFFGTKLLFVAPPRDRQQVIERAHRSAVSPTKPRTRFPRDGLSTKAALTIPSSPVRDVPSSPTRSSPPPAERAWEEPPSPSARVTRMAKDRRPVDSEESDSDKADSPQAPASAKEPEPPVVVPSTEVTAQVPVQAPVQVPAPIPVQAPVQTPAPIPIQTPVQTPAPIPVQAPVQVPAQIPVQTLVQAPAQDPAQAPTLIPASAPALAPTLAPVQIPASAPAPAPASAPVLIPVSAPVQAPIQAPALEAPTHTATATDPPTTVDSTHSPEKPHEAVPSTQPGEQVETPQVPPAAPKTLPEAAFTLPKDNPADLKRHADELVERVAPTYDLTGLLAGAIVFHRTATISASEAVRSVLATNPGMMRGEAGARIAALSPSKRKLHTNGKRVPECGEIVAGWLDVDNNARWAAAARRAWHSHLEAVLTSGPMFGEIQRPGKDRSGNPLESWFHYDKENDPDRERATNLGAFAKPMRNAVRSQKPIFWKRSEFKKATTVSSDGEPDKLPYSPRAAESRKRRRRDEDQSQTDSGSSSDTRKRRK